MAHVQHLLKYIYENGRFVVVAKNMSNKQKMNPLLFLCVESFAIINRKTI